MPPTISVPDFSSVTWFLINQITRPMAGFWWIGPLVMLFAWGLVPVMRARNPVLGVSNYSASARFWWAPGLGFFGITGLGLSLMVTPLLIAPLAEAWQPFAWPGMTAGISANQAALAVVLGCFLALKGIEMYLHALHRDRMLRLHAWRWRMGSGEAPRDPDEKDQ